MSDEFFERPILNGPYDAPTRHWELDDDGLPTHQILQFRRPAKFISPVPLPRRRRGAGRQGQFVMDEGEGISSEQQQYDTTSIINTVRRHVDQWRAIPNPRNWNVTPETARLLQHWRHHTFGSIRPFFCQIEAVETAIWLTEVAPKLLFPRASSIT